MLDKTIFYQITKLNESQKLILLGIINGILRQQVV